MSTSSKKDLKEKHILSSCEKFQITIFLPFISEIFRKVFDKYFEASEGIIHDGNVETQTSDACLDEIAYMNMTAIIYNGVHSGISLRSKKLQPLSLNSQASFSSSYLEGEPRKILAELINNVSNFVDTCPYDAAKNLRNSNLWIDERIYLKMYLQQKENAIARRDLSNTPDTEQCIQTVNVNMNPAFSPILHSPSRAKQSYHNSPLRSPSTPISIVFEAVSWLSSTVVNLPSELTEDFKAELSDISQEISVSVLRTIDDVIPIAFSQLGSISSEIWKFRKELGLKLFFKLLEKVFRKELENKNYSPIGVSRLLTNVEFQRALLAISYEIMATSYKVPRFCFPKILESFNLSSFEFNKVIEVVFSCEKGMPRSIRHHLQDIEQKIVLYFAWQPNDKMIGFLCKHKEFLSDLKVTFEEEEQCKFRRLEDVAVRSPPSKNKGQKFAVELLYRNLLKISSDRLEELSYDTSLGITPPLIDVIWILLKSIIFDHFHLMFGRHFDSILLCSIYAVNRLAKRNSPVTFKSIISSYLNRYPTNYDLVITRIYLENSSPKHIIEFYNSTFISTLKSFITEKLTKILSKRLAAGFANSSLSSPRKLGVRPTPLNAGLVTPPSFRNPLTSPGKSPLNISNSSNWVPNSSPITKRPMPKVTIDGVANIYVSPKKRFRAQGFRTPGSSVSTNLQNSSQNSSENSNKSSSAPAMTPRTGLLYAFGESPARLLHMHNSRVHQDLGRLGNMNPHKSPHGPLAANSKSSLDPVGRQRILSLPSRSSEEMPALSSTYSCSDSDDGTESVTNQSA